MASFYSTVYMSSENVPPGFTGDIASCQPGAISSAYQNAGLTRILYYRAMAGLTADVVLSPAWNAQCQAAALMMTANQKLSHTPPATWTCYTASGAEAASKSNLAAGFQSLYQAVDGLVADGGLVTVGHRRWFLYPPEQTMAVGATPGVPYPAYVYWVIGGTGPRPPAPEWVGWPGPGYFPDRKSVV